MAFHPLRTFQKNKTFWMAALILMTMITFVLCTGVGGDLSDRLIRLFAPTRENEAATINGRRIYPHELEQLKAQRDIANEFMRAATLISLERLADRERELRKDKDPRYEILLSLIMDLKEKYTRPRYFDSGTKTEELLDFILLRNLADERGIELRLDNIDRMVTRLVHGGYSNFTQADYREVQSRVRQTHYTAADDVQIKALTDEFRVRIVMLELMNSRMLGFEQARQFLAPQNRPLGYDLSVFRRPLTPAQMFDYYVKNRTEMVVELIPVALDAFAQREPGPSDDKMVAFFERYLPAEEEKEAQGAKKTSFEDKAAKFFARYGKTDKYDPAGDVSFVIAMNNFFDKHKKNKYNPASETAGFYQLDRVKVQWVSADARSDHYRNLARAMTTLQSTPPVALEAAAVPLPLAMASYMARCDAFDVQLKRTYERYRSRQASGFKYLVYPWNEPNFAYELYWRDKKDPAVHAVAALAGLCAQQNFGAVPVAAPSFAAAPVTSALAFAAPTPEQIKKWEPIVALERTTRAPVFATVTLAGIADQPWTFLATHELLNVPAPQFLPLAGHIRDEMRDHFEREMAQRWVNTNMIAVKKKVDSWKEDKFQFKRELPGLIERLGLRSGHSQWHDQFSIATDPALAPLRTAFEKEFNIVNQAEGRFGKEAMLRRDDFHRLFFEGDHIGVGNMPAFKPRTWPPTVALKPDPADPHRDKRQKEENLFNDAELPFLFWKTETQPARAPESITQVYRLVEQTYRWSLVRDKAIPEVKKLTDELRKELRGKDRREIVRSYAKKQGTEFIPLPGVAPLIEIPQYLLRGSDNPKGYIPYELSPAALDKLIYPSDEMDKQLIAFHGGKEPVKTGNKDLDKLNKELIDARGIDPNIQVFTNKPRTVYYVAVEISKREPSADTFRDDLYIPATGVGRNRNLFIDQCQLDLGTAFRHELLEQLRRQANREITDAGRKLIQEEATRAPGTP